MTQQEKEKMFLDLNSVLVKFWIEQGRPDKEIKIELLERMLNWQKKAGIVIPDEQSKEPVSEDLEEAAEKCIDKALFKWSYDDEDGIEQYIDDAFKAGAEWQKEQMLKETLIDYLNSVKGSIGIWIEQIKAIEDKK